SLGAVFYELLTGQPPFTGASPLETVLAVLDQEPEPPRSVAPAVPRDLETIALKCLRKEPGQRYESAAALAEDLERWLRGEPILARPVGSLERAVLWARRRPALATLAATTPAALIALFVVGVVFNARALNAYRTVD